MAQWNSGATWSSGSLWGPVSPPAPTFENTNLKKTKRMKRQRYYPQNQGDQSEWHTNFATKLPLYSTTLGLTQPEEDSAVADNLILAYALGGWIVAVREYGPACTSALKTLAAGTGSTEFAFPTVGIPTPPTLPGALTGVNPGALERTFDLAVTIKRQSGYTESIGLDLGIVGPEAPPPPPGGEVPPPRITVTAISGDTHQYGRVKFVKEGHEYVIISSRRGGGAWEELGMTNASPYVDMRPLLVADQAEVREYRARFFDDGTPSSEWCDVAKLTLGP